MNITHETGKTNTPPAATKLRVAVISECYPNRLWPQFGIFVKRRIAPLADRCDIHVLAPLPHFPLRRLIKGTDYRGVPELEIDGPVTVHHPRFFSVPGLLKGLDARFFERACRPIVEQIHSRMGLDLLDAHWAYPTGAAAARIAHSLKLPMVLTLRGAEIEHARSAAKRRQIRQALEYAQQVVCLSHQLRELALELGADEQKTTVIGNGIDAAVFHPLDRQQTRRRLGLPDEAKLAVMVGHLCANKGFDTAIRNWPAVLKRHDNARLLIVGGDTPVERLSGKLEGEIRRHGLQQAVTLLGAQPPQRVNMYLNAADVFILASRREGWPNAPVEALAAGCPVVGFDVGAMQEIICDESMGRLVRPGDEAQLTEAICWALSQRFDRAHIARQGQRRSWRAVAEQVLQKWLTATRDAATRTPP